MRNRNGSPPSSLDSVQTEKNSDSADGSRFRVWPVLVMGVSDGMGVVVAKAEVCEWRPVRGVHA
ncbi:hypothetical protein ERO13_A07G187550v2 [Gossypium hirsutum]|nr:hypothetical protein ERO13_D08G252650v2 [Gossypium hirsutum]KAG4192914.1 hypothetical protein ERO13_A07G187550v2 [Gossypium hirsutum]